MQKPVVHMGFAEWVADQIKAMAPYAKTVKAVYWYFAAGYDDVNVEFSRKVGGYSNSHFTDKSLAEYYGAESVAFDTDFGIDLTMPSWDCVTVGDDGRPHLKKKNARKSEKQA